MPSALSSQGSSHHADDGSVELALQAFQDMLDIDTAPQLAGPSTVGKLTGNVFGAISNGEDRDLLTLGLGLGALVFTDFETEPLIGLDKSRY